MVLKGRLFKACGEFLRYATVKLPFMEQQGYDLDITDKRLHHEIYLSDARKVAPEKLKTVIRHPIRGIDT